MTSFLTAKSYASLGAFSFLNLIVVSNICTMQGKSNDLKITKQKKPLLIRHLK